MENIYFTDAARFDQKPWNNLDLTDIERRKTLNDHAISLFKQKIQDLIKEKGRFFCGRDKKIIKNYIINMLNDFISELEQKEDHYDAFRLADTIRHKDEHMPNTLTKCVDKALSDDECRQLLTSDPMTKTLLEGIKKESMRFEKYIVMDEEQGFLKTEEDKSIEKDIRLRSV